VISRYTRGEMGAIWEEEEKFRIWLQIEILVCEAWAKLKKIPAGVVEEIKRKTKFDVKRIKEIEKEVKHDVVAFLINLSENVGPASKYIHMGLTSSDILDTALAVQLKKASEIIIADVERVLDILKEKALEYKDTVMMGRTHGVHAEPITLGLKFALWYEEIKRNLERIKRAKEEISYGKISGAVGTYAHLDPWIEQWVCRQLGLKPCPISNQIVQRDRHCFYLACLAILASSLDKFCLEIRGLHRTEIRELEEGFGKGQKGSSAMPHKKNPIICERICGLARLLRSNLQAALENIPLWGERDISHSSCERVILPDSTILIDYMLTKFAEVIENLRVYPENMKENMKLSRGLFFSQRLMLKLVEKGLSRQEAYDLVQRNSMQSWEKHREFEELVKKDSEIGKWLTPEEIAEIFNRSYYTRFVDKIMEKAGIL